MIIKKMTLIALACTSLLQASNHDIMKKAIFGAGVGVACVCLLQTKNYDNIDRAIFGTALATALTTGSLIVWRMQTSYQDEAVIKNVTTILQKQECYNAAQRILCNDANKETQRAQAIGLILGGVEPNAIKQKINNDLETLASLRTWNVWMRSYFNVEIESKKIALEEQRAKIIQVREALIENK